MKAEGNHKEGKHAHRAEFAPMDEVERQCWRGPGLWSLEAAGYDIPLTYNLVQGREPVGTAPSWWICSLQY